MKKILLGIGIIVLLFSCQKDKMMIYEGSNQIELSKGYKDTLDFTFAFHPEEKSWRLWIPVKLTGNLSDRDRMYYVDVVDTLTTAQEGFHYEKISREQVFRAGVHKDSLLIIIKRTTDLDAKRVILGIVISSSEELSVVTKTNNRTLIRFTAQLGRPDWWDQWHESNGLGKYSKKKYELFIREMKVSDLDWQKREDLNYSEMRALVLGFKYWLLDNPQIDEDGSKMEVN
ncbi:MAG: DUF4843 domain-containing protein, partial [Odoribacter sp.]